MSIADVIPESDIRTARGGSSGPRLSPIESRLFPAAIDRNVSDHVGVEATIEIRES